MANVNIKFNDKNYLLSCDDGQEENLQELGIKVRDKDVAIGNPVEEIVKKGDEYSVIAVAASSKQWYQRFFVTGVAFNVMATCETTVLNIR